MIEYAFGVRVFTTTGSGNAGNNVHYTMDG